MADFTENANKMYINIMDKYIHDHSLPKKIH